MFRFGFDFVTIVSSIRIVYFVDCDIPLPIYFVSCADLKMSSILLSSASRSQLHKTCPFIDPSIFVMLLYFLPQSISISGELKINIKVPIKLEGIGCKNLYAIHVTEVWSKIPFYLWIVVSFPPEPSIGMLCVLSTLKTISECVFSLFFGSCSKSPL